MTIRAQIVHQTTGRVRVQLPDARGNTELFAQLSEQLVESKLFERVRVNPVTGSVVLEFTGEPEEVLAKLAARLPFKLELSPAPPAPTLKAADNPLRLVSGRDVNPMFVAGTLFGAVGLVQTLRGQIMLPALSAFWYAVNAFRLAHGPTQEGADSSRVT